MENPAKASATVAVRLILRLPPALKCVSIVRACGVS